jgi:hypothetical protein
MTDSPKFLYYVSFVFMSDSGSAFHALDITLPTPISGASDVAIIRTFLTERGYAAPVVLSFCRYDKPINANPGSRNARGPRPTHSSRPQRGSRSS